jgi:hypothetical protein
MWYRAPQWRGRQRPPTAPNQPRPRRRPEPPRRAPAAERRNFRALLYTYGLLHAHAPGLPRKTLPGRLGPIERQGGQGRANAGVCGRGASVVIRSCQRAHQLLKGRLGGRRLGRWHVRTHIRRERCARTPTRPPPHTHTHTTQTRARVSRRDLDGVGRKVPTVLLARAGKGAIGARAPVQLKGRVAPATPRHRQLPPRNRERESDRDAACIRGCGWQGLGLCAHEHLSTWSDGRSSEGRPDWCTGNGGGTRWRSGDTWSRRCVHGG